MSKANDAAPGGSQDDVFDYDGGFLSQQERRYLAGVDDFSSYSNPSVWRGRVEKKYRAALMDLALMNQAPDDVLDASDTKSSVRQDLNGLGGFVEEEMVTAGAGAAENLARTYGDQGLTDLVQETSEVARKVREEREYTQEFMVKAIIQVLAKGEPEYDDVVSFVESFWPEKETVLEIAEREWNGE